MTEGVTVYKRCFCTMYTMVWILRGGGHNKKEIGPPPKKKAQYQTLI